METQPEGGVRDEVLGVLEQLFPNLLTSRDFRSAAAVLRESKLLKDRAANLRLEQIQRLDGFVVRLSEPAIVGQLLQSLDEASGLGLDPGCRRRACASSAARPSSRWSAGCRIYPPSHCARCWRRSSDKLAERQHRRGPAPASPAGIAGPARHHRALWSAAAAPCGAGLYRGHRSPRAGGAAGGGADPRPSWEPRAR